MMQFVCVVCPEGCDLSVDIYGDSPKVTGNKCDRGIAFARQEVYDPQRVLTTTVKLSSGGLLPVRSRGTVKKDELRMLVETLKSTTADPPIEIGQLILSFVGEASVDIIASAGVALPCDR